MPITGVSLLLRALMLGDYGVARRYFLPVLVPTIVYGGVALRWAVDQFQREDRSCSARPSGSTSGLAPPPRPRPRADARPAAGAALLRADADLGLVPDAVSAMAGRRSWGIVAGQLAFILAPPLVDGPPADLRPAADPPAATGRGPRYLLLAVGLVLALNPLVNELRPSSSRSSRSPRSSRRRSAR